MVKLKRVNPVRKLTVHMAVDVRIRVSNIPGPARRNAKGSFLIMIISVISIFVFHFETNRLITALLLDTSNARRASTPSMIALKDCITTQPDNDAIHQPMPDAQSSPPKKWNSETLKLCAPPMAPTFIHTFWIAHLITYAGMARPHC